MQRFVRFLVLVSILAAGTGCASTSIRNSWASPDIDSVSAFDKILVVFNGPDRGHPTRGRGRARGAAGKETVNPTEVAGMVNEIADVVGKNLRDRGLID